MITKIRKVQKTSTGFDINIPKAWAEMLGIEKGSEVLLVFDGKEIKIRKIKKNRKGTTLNQAIE